MPGKSSARCAIHRYQVFKLTWRLVVLSWAVAVPCETRANHEAQGYLPNANPSAMSKYAPPVVRSRGMVEPSRYLCVAVHEPHACRIPRRHTRALTQFVVRDCPSQTRNAVGGWQPQDNERQSELSEAVLFKVSDWRWTKVWKLKSG